MNKENPKLKKKDIVYHTKIFPTLGIYDLDELKVRTVEEDWFVAIEKSTRKAFLFSYDSINKTIFLDRKEALNKVKEAELNKHKYNVSNEIYYEEY